MKSLDGYDDVSSTPTVAWLIKRSPSAMEGRCSILALHHILADYRLKFFQILLFETFLLESQLRKYMLSGSKKEVNSHILSLQSAHPEVVVDDKEMSSPPTSTKRSQSTGIKKPQVPNIHIYLY